MITEELITSLFWGSGGLLGVAMIFRAIYTWMGRQGVITQGDSSQKDLLISLTSEAERWRKLHDDAIKAHEDARKQHEDTLVLLGEVRLQNKLLRILLIQRGMSETELDTILNAIDIK